MRVTSLAPTARLAAAPQTHIARLLDGADSQLMQRIMLMATTARGKPFSRWPAWSTGENLMVALVLDDTAALNAMHYSILEALERVELSPRQLQQIARKVL
ncbi:MAG: hypothetical protein QM740_17970 [Acidovorax sp.]